MKLNEKNINLIKKNSTLCFEGKEAKVYLTNKYALKEFKWYGEGAFNYFVFKNNNVDLILRELENIKQTINDKLIKKYNISTPKILDYYIKKGPIVNFISEDGEEQEEQKVISYILMKRASGSPVFTRKEEDMEKFIGLDDVDAYNDSFADIKHYYYHRMANMLSNGNEQHFDKFVKDSINTQTEPSVFLDVWGENIYYDLKKGYTTLDYRLGINGKSVINKKGYNVEQLTCKCALDHIGFLNESLTNYSGKDAAKAVLKPALDKSINALNKNGISTAKIEREYPNMHRIDTLIK